MCYLHRFLVALMAIIFISQVVNAQAPQWVTALGGSSADEGSDITIDGVGNVYACGRFSGVVDFDKGPGVFNLTANGSTDIYLTKYSPAGQFLWAISMGGTGLDGAYAVEINNANEVILTGYIRGLVDMDPGPGVTLLTGTSNTGVDPGFGGDLFLAKYTTAGGLVWAFSVQNDYWQNSGRGIAIDDQDNIFLGGHNNATSSTPSDFDPGPGVAILSGAGNGHAFLAKYTSSGNYVWGFTMGQYGQNAAIVGVNIVPNDTTLIITGHVKGTNFDVDPGPGVAILNAQQEDIFVGRYSFNKTYLWAWNCVGSGIDVSRFNSIDSAGCFYTTGVFSTTVDFDPGPGVANLTSAGIYDAFVSKYDINGNYRWARKFGSSGIDHPWDIEYSGGRVTSVGYFNGTVDFDPGVATFNLSSAGGDDFYITTFDTAGNFLCAVSMGGPQSEQLWGLKFVGADTFLISGYYGSNSMDADPGPGSLLLSNAGAGDILFGKYYSQNLVQQVSGSVVTDTICAGQNPSITVNFSPALPGTFNGSLTDGVNVVPVNGIQNGVPVFLNVTPAVTTTYTLSVSGSVSNSCSVTPFTINMLFTIPVHGLPQISGTASLPFLCPGGSTTLTGSGGVSYVWTGGISNGISFSPPGSGNYTVTGTDVNGCSNTSIVSIVVFPIPLVVAQASPATVCQGGFTLLTGSGASSYSWSGGVINGVAFSPTVSGAYTVTGTDANGCSSTSSVTVTVIPIPVISATANPGLLCQGATTTLTGSGASNYSWSGGVVNGVPFNPAFSGTYTVTGADANGCSNTATVGVTVNPLPTVYALVNPPALCLGASAILSGSGANLYLWSGGVANGAPFVPSGTNTYTVTGTDANSCSNTSSVTLTVFPFPVIAASANPSVVCPGASTVLTGSGASTYSWTGGITNGSSFVPPSTGTYTVTGIDANGCSGTSLVTVQVLSDLPVSISPSDPVLCLGDSLQLTASGAQNFTWNATPGLSAYTGSTVWAFPVNTTVYSVTGTDANGCSGSATVTVEVVDQIRVLAGKNRDAECGQNLVQLSATGAQNYTWTPATGLSNPNAALTNAQVIQTTTYYVTGTTGSCSATDSVTVYLFNNEENSLYIPNAFTPNGDGNNDCLRVRQQARFTKYYFAVYNRWGEKVFEAENPDACWYGEYKSHPAALDTYYYYLQAESSCGKIFRKGDILLIR